MSVALFLSTLPHPACPCLPPMMQICLGETGCLPPPASHPPPSCSWVIGLCSRFQVTCGPSCLLTAAVFLGRGFSLHRLLEARFLSVRSLNCSWLWLILKVGLLMSCQNPKGFLRLALLALTNLHSLDQYQWLLRTPRIYTQA